MPQQSIYDYNYLLNFSKENNINLLEDYSNIKILKRSIIKSNCINCNEECSKSFETMIKYKFFYCIVCSKKIKEENNLKKFGVKSSLQLLKARENGRKYRIENNNEIQQKKKQTNIIKYGVEHPLQSKEIIDKIQQTNLEKYGNVCSLHCIENQEKVKQTLQINYGVDNPSKSKKIQEKKENTCMKNNGVKNPLQMEETKQKNRLVQLENKNEIREKTKNTCLERYGVEHHTQNAKIMEKCSKNAYKLKDYVLPSGNIIKIQGTENYALDELLKEGIIEEEIINGCKNVPEVWYEDTQGKKHRYYVDIFIPIQNRCIEVKSTWTAEKKKDCIFLKQQALKDAGYECEIWVYNGKGEKVECYK
jgi:hypothetical protein